MEFILLGRFAGSVDPINGSAALDRSSLEATFGAVTGCLDIGSHAEGDN